MSIAGKMGFVVLSLVYLCPGFIAGADEVEEARVIAAIVAAQKRSAARLSNGGDEEVSLEPGEEKIPVFIGEEPETFLQYLKKRTRLGVGFDETYNNNALLNDNSPDKEYITTLESLVTFVDPRGPLTLGGSYEVNAFRHHRRRRAAINHDVKTFVEYDTGRRILCKLDYALETTNRLVRAPGENEEGDEDDPFEFDVVRRSGDFQQQVTHVWTSTIDYALDEVDTLTSKTKFDLLDDQAVDDETTDRRIIETKLDLTRQLREKLKGTAGYTFTDTTILNKEVNSTGRHLGSLKAEYDFNDFFSANGGVFFSRTYSQETLGKSKKRFAPFGGFKFTLKPGGALPQKAELRLKYTDETKNSFLKVDGPVLTRTRKPSAKLTYTLTPKVSLEAEWTREFLKQEALSGGVGTRDTRLYSLDFLMKWQAMEQGSFELDYSRKRNGTSDTTQAVVTLGFEMTF